MNDGAYQKVWQYIKTMGYFTVVEIQILLALDDESDISPEEIEKYLMQLYSFGIITKAEEDSYVLKENLGYFAPKILNDSVVYNPNNDQVVSFVNLEFNLSKNHIDYLYSGGKNDKIIH